MSAISSLQYNWQLTGAGGENRALSSFQSLETIQREKHRNQQPKDKARSADIPDQATEPAAIPKDSSDHMSKTHSTERTHGQRHPANHYQVKNTT